MILKIASAFDVGKVDQPGDHPRPVHRRHDPGTRNGAVRGLHLRRAGPSAQPVVHRQQDPHRKDLPEEIECIAVETAQLDGPYGARGVGEHPMISVGPGARQRDPRRDRRRADAHADALRGRLAGDEQQGAGRDLDHQDAGGLLPVASRGGVGRRLPPGRRSPRLRCRNQRRPGSRPTSRRSPFPP